MTTDQQGRTFLVTGANTGIGRETAETLARQGAHVVLACRSEQKAQPVLDGIRAAGGNAEFLQLDLASLASVRAAAEEYVARGHRLDCLLANAGVAGHQGKTEEGFELAFGVNHLGHFLLTTLLLPTLKESAPSRIVFVSSDAHTHTGKGINFDGVQQTTRTVTAWREYAVSKLANVLCSAELSRRLDGTGVTTYSLCPGAIASDVWRRVPWPLRPIMLAFMKSVADGAQTPLYCATEPSLAAESGKYYRWMKRKEVHPYARDEALAAELWKRSEEWTARWAAPITAADGTTGPAEAFSTK
jgi:retinol dehydrogenase 12